MELTIDLVLVIASSVILLLAFLYIIYYFKNLNYIEEKKKVSNENNYSGANFHAEYKFDGKYKKKEYITSGKIIFFVLLFVIFLYFQYYQDGFNYSNRSSGFGSLAGPGIEDISMSNITLFGAAANSLSGNTSVGANTQNNYRSSKRRGSFGKRNRSRSVRGRGSSFRSRSYGGGGK